MGRCGIQTDTHAPAPIANDPPTTEPDTTSAPSSRHSPAFYIRLWRLVRRLAVLVIGATVVLVGIVLIVTPGPAFVVIPVGLAILASEFLWARRLLRRLREQAARAAGSVSNHFSRNTPPPS